MGGLRKFMPITAATFIVGWLAIAGVPPFAGFWSKDEILLFALADSPALYVVGLVTALLTAYYMTRQVFMVFFGEARWEDRAAEHGAHGDIKPHESPWIMLFPLVVLAVLSIVGGVIELPFSDDHGSASSTGSSRSSSSARRTSTARGPTTTSTLLLVDRHRRRRSPASSLGLARVPAAAGQGRSSRRSSPTPGTTTRRSPRSWAGPAARRFEAPPGSTRTSSTARSTAPATAVRASRRRAAQGPDRVRAQLRRRSSASASSCCSPGSSSCRGIL